ncbi:hypothetical protein QJS66_02350 [Kocuria rhizophila]|nr:hypothetical protein QJS66_02350 [Kocuria rhizophila]
MSQRVHRELSAGTGYGAGSMGVGHERAVCGRRGAGHDREPVLGMRGHPPRRGPWRSALLLHELDVTIRRAGAAVLRCRRASSNDRWC